MTRVLLNRYHQRSQEAFLKGLPKTDLQNLANQNTPSEDVAAALTAPLDKIRHIHYSWLIPILKSLPEGLKSLTVAALPQPQSGRLCKFLKMHHPKIPLSPPVKTFLINTLYERVDKKKTLPVQYLPQTELSILASLSKDKLIVLIDFLGLFDLAESIRQIVDTKTLKNIYSCLDAKKQQFLRICLHQKEKVSSHRLDLNLWHGECHSLHKILHRRGLHRLGRALIGQHPDFIWHVLHTLDSGRGKLLSVSIAQEESTGISSALAQQVQNTLNFLKKE